MTTPLDALVTALRNAASYNAAAEAPPEAVVWCDANREFAPLLPLLRERLPELLTYGEFDAAKRTGPAVWLRAAVAGAVPAVNIPEGATPVLYLPGVARETLKGADDCPPLLQPLVWFTLASTVCQPASNIDPLSASKIDPPLLGTTFDVGFPAASMKKGVAVGAVDMWSTRQRCPSFATGEASCPQPSSRPDCAVVGRVAMR